MTLQTVTITRSDFWKEAYEIRWHDILYTLCGTTMPHLDMVYCGDSEEYKGEPIQPGKSMEFCLVPKATMDLILRYIMQHKNSLPETDPEYMYPWEILEAIGGNMPDPKFLQGESQ